MNNLYPKILILLLSFTLVVSAKATDEAYYKETKKTVNCNSDARLDMNIDYADVNVSVWDQSKMEIIVKQNIETKSESRANEIFNNMTIYVSETPERVTVNVSMGNYSCKGNSESYDIIVDIKMPKNSGIDGSVTFGDLTLADMTNSLDIKIEYGTLRANALSSANNDVHMSFGDATIMSTGGGDFKNEYGEMKVRKLTGNAEFTSQFGDLDVQNVTSSVKKLEIDVEYGDAEIQLSKDVGFQIDAHCSYGDIELPDEAKISTNTSDYVSKDIKGTLGNGSGKLEINADFGDVEVEWRE